MSKKELNLVPGQCVYVVERDEDGDPYDFSAYMFLATIAGKMVISCPFYMGCDDLDKNTNYLIKETMDGCLSSISCFPLCDCYASATEAKDFLNTI